MSRIFEALQRSESERLGEDLLAVESVAELLQSAGQEQPRQIEIPRAESFGAAPVLHPAPGTDARLVCLTDQGTLGAEKFRLLGLRLRHLRDQRKLKRIVVTSTIPQEGKSLISANLALNQARSKVLRTVLIDGDLRRPALATRFGFNRTLPGLSECLRGERPLSEVVYRLEGPGLWFLPAGIAPENPIELMQLNRLSEILDQLGAFFDWMIIDTPPILPLADTPLWMKLADGVLMVTREGVCEKKLLGKAVEAVDPANVLGVVVNSCSINEQKYYYSRYSPDALNSQESVLPQTEV